MLIAAICVPEAFGDLALAFALAIGFFRVAHIALFTIARRRRARTCAARPARSAVSTAIAVALLAVASAFDGLPQAALWVLALALDFGGPYFFGVEGWQLVPGHFAERHGLIIIIALGESIVEIGAGAAGHLDLGDRRRRGARGRRRGGDVVGLLRRRRAGLGAAARRGRGGPRAERARPRLLLLPAPLPRRRDRGHGLRPEDGHRPDRRAPRLGDVLRAARPGSRSTCSAWSPSATARKAHLEPLQTGRCAALPAGPDPGRRRRSRRWRRWRSRRALLAILVVRRARGYDERRDELRARTR